MQFCDDLPRKNQVFFCQSVSASLPGVPTENRGNRHDVKKQFFTFTLFKQNSGLSHRKMDLKTTQK